MRRSVLILITVAAILAVSAGAAFAAVRTGTEGDDVLLGTIDNDKITGKGGNDFINGRKGNDLYNYADGWGVDAVRDSEGRDTLNFSQVTANMEIYLCSDWLISGVAQGYATDGTNKVVYGSGIIPEVTQSSHIENAKGGLGADRITGCGLNNKMSAGGHPSGLSDLLADIGGMVDTNSDPDRSFPSSNEVYSGLGKPGQSADILDYGGTDVVNLKPWTTDQVKLYKFDNDPDSNTLQDTLVISTGATTGFHIYDANGTWTQAGLSSDGTIEEVIFKDKTLSSTQLMNQAADPCFPFGC